MVEKVFSRPKSMYDAATSYCPGCGHGIIQRLVGELIDEFELQDRLILCAPIGCSGPINNYLDVDTIKGPHGRAPAIATGARRVCPDKFIMTYQGDGDLGGIGTAEIVHAAGRGERITTIFVNNAIYGMTGGQMAPTTLVGQVTQTSPSGRDAKYAGHPIRITEMLAQLDGVAYLERVAVNTPANIIKAKAAIKKAFEMQLQDRGFALIEVLSMCPTNWGMTPLEAAKWVGETMARYYPLGVIKPQAGGERHDS